MAMVNIPSTCDDPQYRYKMPRLITKKEGRGNGSKTCIVNMSDVARALKRPPQYTTKWFGSELGAQSTYTNKEGEGERAIVNGHHDTPIFGTMLDKFIDKYVLCENCHLPEIDMNVKKGSIVAKCAACGWAGDLDNNHKIAAFITKNPPDGSGHGIVNLTADTGAKKSKEDRRKERDEKRKARTADGGEGSEGEEDEDDADAKPKKEKKERSGERKEKKERSGEKKEKKEKKVKGEGEDGEGEEDEEAKRLRREKRKEKKEARAEGGAVKEKKERSSHRTGEKKEKKERPSKKEKEESDNDSGDGKDKEEEIEYDCETAKDVIRVMKEYIASKDGKAKPEDFFEEIRMQQIAKEFTHKIRFYLALEALMPDGSMDAKTLGDDNTKKVLDKVLSAAELAQSDRLWCFDAYLAQNEKAIRTYPMVLKVIYDEEWANEESILKYYVQDGGADEPGFEKAKTSGAPFFKWLQTAESSGSGDEDDESGSEEA